MEESLEAEYSLGHQTLIDIISFELSFSLRSSIFSQGNMNYI